jgi:predicted small lipoprotein YifL
MRILLTIAAIAALAACGQTTTVEAPAEPAAVEAPAPTVVMITEADARTRAEGAGYTNITGLVQNPDGSWTATGTQGGATTSITITDSGVTAATTPAPTTP